MFNIIRALHSVSPLKKFQVVSEINENGERRHVVHLHFGEVVPFSGIGSAIKAAGFRVVGNGRNYIVWRGNKGAANMFSTFKLERNEDGKGFALTKERVKRGKGENAVPLGLLERPLLERRVAKLLRLKV